MIAQLARPRSDHGFPGNDPEGIPADLHLGPASPLDRLDVHLCHITDFQAPALTLGLVLDGNTADAGKLPNVLAKDSKVAPGLAAKDLSQCAGLHLRRPLVQIQGDPPRDLDHATRRMDCQCYVESAQIRAVHAAGVDVPSYQYRAIPGGRWAQKDTRTGCLAVTRLEVVPGNRPIIGHDKLLLVGLLGCGMGALYAGLRQVPISCPRP